MNIFNYTLEINVNDVCNFRCEYCYEGDSIKHHRTRSNTLDWYKEYITNFKNSEFLKTNYGGLVVGFWGGEPTLDYDFIVNIVKHFENSGIYFFVYTNGSNLVQPLLDLMVDKKYGFGCQISYDGNPVHDNLRKDFNGNTTSKMVKETILKIKNLGINYSVKSTINKNNIKNMYQAYLDVVDTEQNYFPTFDHTEKFNMIEEEKAVFYKELEEQLKLIIKHSLKTKKQFAWFKNINKLLCSAGAHSSILDLDGNLYACHGCLYGGKEDHKLSDEPKYNEFYFKRAKELYGEYLKKPSFECNSCSATTCYRCQAHSFSNSKKKLYSDKWMDFSNNNGLCEFYGFVSKYSKAYNQLKG